MKHRDEGFTLVELMTVILILGVLVTIAVPAVVNSRAKAADTACLANRTIVSKSDYSYYLQNGTWSTTIQSLVGTWMKSTPVCPDGGVYAWIDTPTAEQPVRTLGCSVHYFPVQSLTPLGSTFSEISRGMIERMLAFYAKNGRWPSSQPPASYTDLGLTAADWAKAVEHLNYTPGGSKVSIRPESGYVVTVVDSKGKTRTLKAGEQDIFYDGKTGKWYYKEVNKENVVDIATIQVQPAKK